MPGFDQTGPQGEGSMTGRGLGVCNTDTSKTQTSRPLGLQRGFRGRGFRGQGNQARRLPGSGGRGRGRMNMFFATGQPGYQRTVEQENQSTSQEIQSLKELADGLKTQLEQVQQKLSQLEKD